MTQLLPLKDGEHVEPPRLNHTAARLILTLLHSIRDLLPIDDASTAVLVDKRYASPASAKTIGELFQGHAFDNSMPHAWELVLEISKRNRHAVELVHRVTALDYLHAVAVSNAAMDILEANHYRHTDEEGWVKCQ